jgi:hypothetical protein
MVHNKDSHRKAAVSLEPVSEGVETDLLTRRSNLLIYCKTLLLSLAVIRCYFVAAITKNPGFSPTKSGLWLFFYEFISEISEAYRPPGSRIRLRA